MARSRFAQMTAAEIGRRHALLCAAAQDGRLDALVALGNEDDMSGYVRWFTDEPVSSYRTVVMFVPGDGVTVIEHGAAGGAQRHDPEADEYHGVSSIHTVASFQSAAYTAGYEAETLTGLIRKRAFARVGLVGGANMPYRFLRRLMESLEGVVEFVDATNAVDAMMMIKSPEEQAHIRAAAELQDEVFAAVLAEAKPGMREIDVTARARAASLRLGGSAGVILAGSARQSSFAPFKLTWNQNWVIREGDYLSLLIENAGPSGHFTEVARNIVFGKAGSGLLEACEQARTLQEQILPFMRPGASCADVFRQHNDQRIALRHPAENRIFAHGQGYNLVERPLVRTDEPGSLEAGMNLAVHPTLADGHSCFAVMCDNFLLSEGGEMVRLHRTEQKVFEI